MIKISRPIALDLILGEDFKLRGSCFFDPGDYGVMSHHIGRGVLHTVIDDLG